MISRDSVVLRVCVSLLLASGLCVATASPSQAVAYGPSWTKLTEIKDPCGKWNPMRSGYWNTESRRGWGYFKMALKHNLTKWDVWETTVDMTCGNQEGSTTTWRYYASSDPDPQVVAADPRVR